MKIIEFSRKEGIIKVIPETLDDLWHLSKVVEEEDLTGAISSHKVKIGGVDDRQRATRKTSFFQIKVDKVELDFASEALKLSGKITKGPKDVSLSSSHTLTIEVGTSLELIKQKWKAHQIKRINDSKDRVKSKVLICLIDDDIGLFYSLSDSGAKELSEMELSLARKASIQGSESGKGYEDLLKAIISFSESIKPSVIVLAGPGFWKDEMFKVVKNKNKELAKKIKTEYVSSASKSGVQELISKGVLLDAARKSQLQEESEFIEELKFRMAKNSAVAYGFTEVKNASLSGAVEKLAISEKIIDLMRKDGSYAELEEIVDAVENGKGNVFILDSKSDAGRVIDSLGGIAGLLRYRL